MEEKDINPAQSFELIDSMINTAKNKLADDGFLYIFWGWLIFTSALVNYVSFVLHFEYGYRVWWVAMPLGGIISGIYGYTQSRKDKTRTYIDVYLGYSWSAFIIAIFITLVFMEFHGVKATYFFLMLLYGIATLVSGGLLNFKPLVIGSSFSFAFAVVAVFVGINEQFLCLAGSILCSYIIPGHLLQNKYKSQVNV